MALPEAIAAIEGQLTNPLPRQDIVEQGERPSQGVYRSGLTVNIHGEKVHYVTIDMHRPATRSYVTDEDIEATYADAETMLDWLASKVDVGGMLVYWPEYPRVEFDWESEASAHITVGLCERYPRA